MNVHDLALTAGPGSACSGRLAWACGLLMALLFLCWPWAQAQPFERPFQALFKQDTHYALANQVDYFLVRAGQELGKALAQSGVWRNRQGLVRACVSRHTVDDFYRLLQLGSAADAAAKGQAPGDPWQLTTEIVLGLAMQGARAA